MSRCDQYGGKEVLVSLLVACAIPCGLGGFLIQSYETLLAVRFLTGFVGGTIVPVKFWVASHFAPETAGLAIATATGFGNVGAGLAQLLVGGLLMPFLQKCFKDNDDLAWRVALSIPSVFSLAVAFFFHYHADDCPLGAYREVRRAGFLTQRSAVDSFRTGALNLNAWLLFFQFGAALGIELVMESGLTMYLSDTFELSVRRAAGLASLFGLMNLWARGTGGFLSDCAHRWFALRGRLCLQMILLLLEGLMIIGFIRAGNSLRTTLLWMLAFAATGQMAMGAAFGVIPLCRQTQVLPFTFTAEQDFIFLGSLTPSSLISLGCRMYWYNIRHSGSRWSSHWSISFQRISNHAFRLRKLSRHGLFLHWSCLFDTFDQCGWARRALLEEPPGTVYPVCARSTFNLISNFDWRQSSHSF